MPVAPRPNGSPINSRGGRSTRTFADHRSRSRAPRTGAPVSAETTETEETPWLEAFEALGGPSTLTATGARPPLAEDVSPGSPLDPCSLGSPDCARPTTGTRPAPQASTLTSPRPTTATATITRTVSRIPLRRIRTRDIIDREDKTAEEPTATRGDHRGSPENAHSTTLNIFPENPYAYLYRCSISRIAAAMSLRRAARTLSSRRSSASRSGCS